ncbi:hypothetical protein RN001_006189 [Aquatica leii]|uniref:G-protein coupled receptors family 1 profile domain-containing protein n=1 Tax=Aquatica leii TaxID=1421715 RepID=A0AAN7SS74_9COLE|nr:hypothetical protein RN001_006189 [Aquatica leii]
MLYENDTFEENYTNVNISFFSNETTNRSNSESLLYPITLVIPITVIYGFIFVAGLVGNISTCIVISRSKSLHTATNYYLFSLAISDLLLLVSGLPPEMYRIWSPETYVFGEAFCILQGFAAETSANATVLTITAFTVERYLAICHPFLSHTMSKLSRAVKYVIAIWIIAFCLAAPQAMQFGVAYEDSTDGIERSRCTVVYKEFYFQRAFEISTFVFFVGPMTLITILYILIGLKLQNAKMISIQRRDSSYCSGPNEIALSKSSKSTAAQKRVIKMLVAVVVAFFVCWAPFHAQRLLAVYLSTASQEAQKKYIKLYIVLMYTSGVLYFVSTSVNPVLYHIMSKKYREAFKTTFSQMCRPNSSKKFGRNIYSSLFRHQQSLKTYRTSSQTENLQTYRKDNTFCNSKYFNQDKSTKSCDDQSALKETILIHERSQSFRSRMSSDTSQVTVLTNLSKSLAVDRKMHRQYKNSLQRSASTGTKASVRIESLNEKYLNHNKRNILSYGMFKLFTKQNGSNNNDVSSQNDTLNGRNTNTISNSSLQDMDESEFNSSELAQYMERVNSELI